MDSIKLSIIIVSWEVKDFLRKCLESLHEGTQFITYEIFVVDNNSIDGTVEMIEKEFPSVILIKNSENVGFARANNQAIRKSRGEYILLLNPDTIILNSAIRQIIEFMDNNSSAGMATCKILNSDGTIQRCYGTFPSLQTILFGGTDAKTAIQSLLLTDRFFDKAGFNSNEYDQQHKVDWIMGAFMMVRRKVVENVGLLDDNIFMFWEEVDWCYRIFRHGWEIWYCPSSKIIHFGGQSTGKCPEETTTYRSLNSQYYCFYKNFGAKYVVWSYIISIGVTGFKLLTFLVLRMLLIDPKKEKYIRRKIRIFKQVLKWHRNNKIRDLSSVQLRI